MTKELLQLSLSFERPQFDSLLDVVNHAVHTCGREFKAIAGDLDRSPGELRMMLSGYEGRKFPANDLPRLIEICGDSGKTIVHFLVEKYLTPQEDRISQAAEMLIEFGKTLSAIQKAAEVVMRAQEGKR